MKRHEEEGNKTFIFLSISIIMKLRGKLLPWEIHIKNSKDIGGIGTEKFNFQITVGFSAAGGRLCG